MLSSRKRLSLWIDGDDRQHNMDAKKKWWERSAPSASRTKDTHGSDRAGNDTGGEGPCHEAVGNLRGSRELHNKPGAVAVRGPGYEEGGNEDDDEQEECSAARVQGVGGGNGGGLDDETTDLPLHVDSYARKYPPSTMMWWRTSSTWSGKDRAVLPRGFMPRLDKTVLLTTSWLPRARWK